MTDWPKYREEFTSFEGDTAITNLPDDLSTNYLKISGCSSLTELPENLSCGHLLASGSGLRSINAGARIFFELVLTDCVELEELPAGLKLATLDITRCSSLKSLPSGLSARTLYAVESGLRELPEGLHVCNILNLHGCRELKSISNPGLHPEGELIVSKCDRLETLPEGINISELFAARSGLKTLPPIKVERRIDLRESQALIHLPDGLETERLYVRNCRSLTKLPEDMNVYVLDISGCDGIADWPESGNVKGRFIARDCSQLVSVPEWLSVLSELDVSGCTNLTKLPAHLKVVNRLDLGGTALSALPEGCRSAPLFWYGIAIDERIAFRPETITAAEILSQPNAELRRVLLDRMGFIRFVEEAGAEVIDTDVDSRGGERKLLRVEVADDDEPLVCVSVVCPSTSRQYTLRVPPVIATCHEAVAWIAGFEDASAYAPLEET